MDHGITTLQLITGLCQSFCRNGIPEIIWSGGLQFTSNLFQEFAKQCGFSHKASTPHYPQVEATVKSMKKSSVYHGMDDHSTRTSSVGQYRNTPSCKDSLSPAQKLYKHHTSSPPILFGRMATQSKSSRTAGITNIKILQGMLQPTCPYSSGNSNLVLGRMVELSNIRSLSNFQQMFCFTKPS